jgi:hypothetical protein
LSGLTLTANRASGILRPPPKRISFTIHQRHGLTLPQARAIATSNYAAGQVWNRHFTVGLGTDGAFKIFPLLTTDLVVDVSGYFAP